MVYLRSVFISNAFNCSVNGLSEICVIISQTLLIAYQVVYDAFLLSLFEIH
jgi:hypothetical protein